MQSLDDMVRRLPPERRTEVRDFVEFLLTKVGDKPRPKMSCDWAGELEDMRKDYSSVDLQNQANRWRAEDEMSR
ncbi:MAG: DUF2281 domain-containing protein [Syntrophobacteraceae bacterium]